MTWDSQTLLRVLKCARFQNARPKIWWFPPQKRVGPKLNIFFFGGGVYDDLVVISAFIYSFIHSFIHLFIHCRALQRLGHVNLLTSSADSAIKKPCVLPSILMSGLPGLMAMVHAPFSSERTSSAISNSFSLMKHILQHQYIVVFYTKHFHFPPHDCHD